MSSAHRNPSTAQPRPGAVTTALLLTLERPGTWAVALAGFLARGGLLLLLLPIVVVPTPAALHTALSPLLVPFLFGEVAPGFVTLVAALVSIVTVIVLVGGLVGAWSEAHLALGATAEEGGNPAGGTPRAGIVLRVLAARVVAHLPLAFVLAWAAARIVQVVYREMTTPFEVVTPLVVRVIAAAPDAAGLILVAWLLGEAAGGLAARELVLGGRGLVRAVGEGWAALVRRPASSLATILLSNLLVALAIAPGLLAVGAAWDWVRAVLYARAGPIEHVAALTVLVGLWIVTVALAGFAAAFRANIWTAGWLRRRGGAAAVDRRPAPMAWPVGTIGDSEPTRPGGWPPSGASGTV